MHRLVWLPHSMRLIVVLVLIVAALASAALFAVAHTATKSERIYSVAELQGALAKNPAAWRGRTVLVRGNATFGPLPVCQAGQSCASRYLFLWPAAHAGVAISYAVKAVGAPPAIIVQPPNPPPSAGTIASRSPLGTPAVLIRSGPPSGTGIYPAPVLRFSLGVPATLTSAMGGPLVLSLGQASPILAVARHLPGLGALMPAPQHIAWYAPAIYRVHLADALPASCAQPPCVLGTLPDVEDSMATRPIPPVYAGQVQRSAIWVSGPTPALPAR